jgi:hypothetical protein
MTSYRNYSTINIEEKKAAAKEKNKSTGTKSFFSLLAAKYKNKPGGQGLEPREELMKSLFVVHLSPPFYPWP